MLSWTGKYQRTARVLQSVMKLNRDVSVLLLNSLGKKNMQIADPLAGSGIRAIRFLKELKRGTIKNISVNDLSENAARNISKNLRLNSIKEDKQKIRLSNEDANLFLLNSTGFDYIDIDPLEAPARSLMRQRRE
jgi:tRNA (guanine26-N2/guanine27-N2)-dimethyltransferase